MTIFGALNAAVSGLNAQAQSLAIISDNIANVDTNAYKGVSARFSAQVAVEPTPRFHTPGGVQINRFQEVERQGLVQASASNTDLAITGQGMFVVGTQNDGGDYLYARDGSFFIDAEGFLRGSSNGYYLQGLSINLDGTAPPLSFANLQSLNINSLGASAQPTSTLSVAANLPSNGAVGQPFQVSLPIFDGEGSERDIDFYFVKTAERQWALTARIDDPGVAFASNSDTNATLSRSVLPADPNFALDLSSLNERMFGALRESRGYKPSAETATIEVTIGNAAFKADFALSNTLPSETNFAYAQASSGVNGSVSTVTNQTLPDAEEITLTIGGVAYVARIDTDGGGGNDVEAGGEITFTNGSDTVQLTSVNAVNLDDSGALTSFVSNLDAAFGGLPAANFFSSGSIVDSTPDLNPGDILVLTSGKGEAISLTIPAGGAAYDLSRDEDLTALATNLQTALAGLVVTAGEAGVRFADVSFDPSGRLENIDATTPYTTINPEGALEFFIDFDNDPSTDIDVDRRVLTLDLGTLGDVDGLRQFAGDFLIARAEQDGARFGEYSGLQVSEAGVFTAIFDNGLRRDIFRVPLARFSNTNGVVAQSGNTFRESSQSGSAQLSNPGAAGTGSFIAGALESSTVDIATEFTRMIITQRAYSASARVVSTADGLIEELLRITS